MLAFAPGFKAALPMITTDDAERTMRAAKARYQSILANVNEFDRDDRFLAHKNHYTANAQAKLKLKSLGIAEGVSTSSNPSP